MKIQVNSDGIVIGVRNSNSNSNQSNGNNSESNTNSSNSIENKGSRPIYLKWKRDRLYDRVLTMAIYESCLDVGEAVVISLTGRPKNKWRPVPLATVELQKRASRYLRIGSESLMTAAEALYQQGFITYPRTETEKFHAEFEHQPLIESFQSVDGDFGEYATKLLSENNFQNPRMGQNDDNAHPPITPAKAVNPETITDPTQRGVYSLVVKHYLACCSRDAIGKETVLTIRISSEEFTAKGLMILERNWLEIYAPWERWSTGQGLLPKVQIGSRIRPSSLLMKDGRTTAPQPISEVELIALMDRNGIGTDATIAQHITTIQDRSYAIKDTGQKFLPTKLGIALVEGYNSMGYQLNKPDLRREMEAECNAVALGRKTREQIMGPMLAKMLECFNRVNEEANKLDIAIARHFHRLGATNENSTILRRDFSVCGSCGRLMALKQLNSQQNDANNSHQPKKILRCDSCSVGLALPKGVPNPMMNPRVRDEHFACPICQYQVIKITEGDGYSGNGYHFCPKCFSEAPREYGGSATPSDFRCFNCTFSACSLATGIKGGDIEVFPCPFCQQINKTGKITLRKNSRGYTLSCSNYSSQGGGCDYTIWLPKEASSISIPDDTQNGNINLHDKICESCSDDNKTVRKVKFRWKPGSVPPHFDREYLGCVLCDQIFKSEIRISIPQLNQVRIRRTNGGRGTTNRRTHRANGRVDVTNRNNAGISCFRCGRSGHYASACPSNQ